MTFLPGFLTSWTTSQHLTIVDARLGLLAWFLKLCVLLYALLSVFLYKQDRIVEEPNGLPTFWFESGDLRRAQNISAAYCNNKAYDNRDQVATSYWNDENIACDRMDYGDITRARPNEGQVTTFVKRLHTIKRPCVGSASPCTTMHVPGNRIVRNDKVSNGSGGFTCTCGKLVDRFVLGADEITMSLQHTFTTSSSLDFITGSSTLSKPTDKQKTIKTCLRNTLTDEECTNVKGISESNFGKCCRKVFLPGETIKYSIREWVSLAGISLDTRVAGGIDRDKVTGEYAFNRVVGLKLAIVLRYYGDKVDSQMTCVMLVKHIDGWTSFGAHNLYLRYKPFVSAEYYENYRRGVRFSFYPQGVISRFDYGVLGFSILAVLVILSHVDTVVGFVACHILPEKATYARAKTGQLKYQDALAKFGIDAALACTAFRKWNTHEEQGEEGQAPKLTAVELAKVYSEKGCLPEDVAQHFVEAIQTALGTDEVLECKNLVQLMSSGLVSLESFTVKKDAEEQPMSGILPQGAAPNR